MERCDFASVASKLQKNFKQSRALCQTEFVECLFGSYIEENEFYFDAGLVNRWMNGFAPVSKSIARFYQESRKNQEALAVTLEDAILPELSDSTDVIQEVYQVLVLDQTISEQKKQELCQHDPCQSRAQEAAFLTDVLVFGMSRPFVKREIRKPNQLPSGNLSLVLKEFVLDQGVPKPCRYFCGREKELEELHANLKEHSKVFLHGIAGIGKSELAKAYAKEHKADYTNLLYLTYSGSLLRDIAELDFVDDLPNDSEAERFRKHNRILRVLKDDTLIIIDNFNVTETQDEVLPVVLKYHCRVLFTTRSLLEGQTVQSVKEISDPEALFQLAARFDSNAEHHRPVLEQIIQAVHCHTLAVELAARLLETGILEPREVLAKLLEEKADFDASDKVSIKKDGKSRKATYYDHIHTLFALFQLTPDQQSVMRSLTLVPAVGIPKRLFGKWMLFTDLNTINDLVELGFVQSVPGCCIALHPMMQEVAVSDLSPSIRTCHTMLESIRASCQMHGKDVNYYTMMFQTVENAIRLAHKDDNKFYLRLLEDVFQYMDNYHYESGMQLVVSELENQLNDPLVGSASDRAILLDCRADLEKKPEKAIKDTKEALALLPEVNAENAHLISNLNANLGGLYYKTRQNPLAKQHLETALRILSDYQLIGYHDSVVQFANCAMLLAEMGEPEQALEILQKIGSVIRENNSAQSTDYAIILEAMGWIYLSNGQVTAGSKCNEEACAIYEEIYESTPEILEQKKAEWRKTYIDAGVRLGEKFSKKKPQ
jgi:tetratricopeptide (TPR) repeat protein